MLHIPIRELPGSISLYRAIERAYDDEVAHAWTRLRAGMSVLIRCEKRIIPYLQGVLGKKLKADGRTIEVVDGRTPGADAPLPRVQVIVAQLRELVSNTERDKIFMLPYLDIITSASRGGLSMEAKEIMTVIHENPFLVFAAFEDPDFPLPELVAQAFPARVSMLGVRRDRLHHLITAGEARKFARGTINLMGLYKYVSGLNPVRLREILATFADHADYNPADPDQLTGYLRELRRFTQTGGVDLSSVQLDRDIAGYAEVKAKIQDNVLGLLELAARSASSDDGDDRVAEIESIVPKGIIFHGPPGTGKTLFAKGIAEAINATVHTVSGPELKSRWVGEGEANIRRLFARARAAAPSVIIFDEIDSIARARTGDASDGGTEAAHSMVNQLLTELDGFRGEELVFVIATTNFLSSLDPAFMRPGRFELAIQIDYPDWDDRRAILALYNRKLGLGLSGDDGASGDESESESDDTSDRARAIASDIDQLASWTERPTREGTRYTGDHLHALMRDLKRHVIRSQAAAPTGHALIAWLRTRGDSKELSAREETVVATHEAGHALMLRRCDRLGEIRRITIESGMTNALGMVEVEPRKNVNLYTASQLRDEIAICLGGYAAEKVAFSETSTGAAEDLRRATDIAEDMVAVLGMGGIEVPRSYTDDRGDIAPFLHSTVSSQVDAILVEVLDVAITYLRDHRALLDGLASALLDQRTLDPETIRALLAPGQPAEQPA